MELEEYINLSIVIGLELINKASNTTFQSYERDNLIYFVEDEYGLNDSEFNDIKAGFTIHPMLFLMRTFLHNLPMRKLPRWIVDMRFFHYLMNYVKINR